MVTQDIYTTVTTKIIDMIESGIFTKPKELWTQNQLNAFSPLNEVTKRHYSGINVLLLACAMLENDYTENKWLTFKQALANETPVKKGSKAVQICFYKVAERTNKENGEKESYPMLKTFYVFNVCQILVHSVILILKLRVSFREIIRRTIAVTEF